MLNVKEITEKKFLFFDGAMGTMLQKNHMYKGEIPEILNITNPQLIREIHEGYIDSGADIITTNTFGANEIKLKNTGFSVEDIIKTAVKIAKDVVKDKRDKYVALDIGPIGELLEPMGELKFERAYEIFKRQIICGVEAGCHIILIETMSDIYEAKAAVLAAKENSKLPVFCTMTFTEEKRTFTGTDPISMVAVLEGLGVDAVGINCSVGPKAMIPVVREILKYSSIPVIVQPNAGLPKIEKGVTVFDVDPECFCEYIKTMAEMGVVIFGGCCGTGYEHIRKSKQNIQNIHPKKISMKDYTCTTSASKTINFNDGIVVVGEKINPTGKSKLKDALRKNNMECILKEAILQKNFGANVLDINMGLPEIDEENTMVVAVKKIQSVLDIPLQIDSAYPNVLEAAARIYNGKPVLNSVNGSKRVMESVFPIVKKYGACVIGLTLDDKGVPFLAEERYAIAEKIVNCGLGYGIQKKDIIIDCLTLTASAQQKEVKETLKALIMVKERLGVKTILGISNVSYGLPRRDIINRTFLAMSLSAGLDAAIMDPTLEGMMDTINAYNLLENQDEGGKKYLDIYSHSKLVNPNMIKEVNEKITLQQAVIKGLKEEALDISKELIKTLKPVEIVDKYLIPALDDVGKMYETEEIFLPQLMQSAEVVKAVFGILKSSIKPEASDSMLKGKIILATVSGDIHDIGKNIVKVLLENYGFEVIDLGKDVDTERIVKCIKSENIRLVGLSALMTTTLNSMEETIKAIRDNNLPCKVMVGGAVLNKRYADMIGADFYAKDARESVEIARRIFKINI